MSNNLSNNMPASVREVPEAAQMYRDLAAMVQDDANPTVVLPKEDARDLTLLTTLGGANVTDGPNGRSVTLMVETAPADAPAASSVKEAAAAQSKFAGQRRER